MQSQGSSAAWVNVNVRVLALNFRKFNEGALEQCDLSLVGGQCGFSLVLRFRSSFPSVIIAYYPGRHLYHLFFKGHFKTHCLEVILQGRNATFPLPIRRYFIYRTSDKKHHWMSNVYRLLSGKRKWTPAFKVMA